MLFLENDRKILANDYILFCVRIPNTLDIRLVRHSVDISLPFKRPPSDVSD